MNENGLKKLDIILLGTLPIAAAIVSLIFKTNLLVSTMLFFGLPSAWLSYRTKSAIKKTAIFAAIFSILMTPMLDYVAVVNGVWVVSTVFPVKLFGTTPAEQFIWGFFFVYFLVIFYEHFFDKSKNEKINPRLKNFVIVFTILSLSFLFVVFINPNIISRDDPKPHADKTNQLEGCLSIPGVWGTVNRSPKLTISYQDEHGTKSEEQCSGFLATIIQHEIDHLQGVLFTQRVLEQKNKFYQTTTDEQGKEVLEEVTI